MIADAEVSTKSNRNSEFDLAMFHQHLNERLEVHLLALSDRIYKVHPDPNKYNNPDFDMPPIEKDYNYCYQRQKLLKRNPQCKRATYESWEPTVQEVAAQKSETHTTLTASFSKFGLLVYWLA